eukprot:TRINITY_DN30924_c0_g1_i2.p2 TRINITY_DN30924_c0_g1~~TRINITY_DN30924_c0_g1_i2.p2  ORF type:complete len:229 (-),score=30.77 TRINITY_DN30924_c0_g1_i2:129-815(-)
MNGVKTKTNAARRLAGQEPLAGNVTLTAALETLAVVNPAGQMEQAEMPLFPTKEVWVKPSVGRAQPRRPRAPGAPSQTGSRGNNRRGVSGANQQGSAQSRREGAQGAHGDSGPGRGQQPSFVSRKRAAQNDPAPEASALRGTGGSGVGTRSGAKAAANFQARRGPGSGSAASRPRQEGEKPNPSRRSNGRGGAPAAGAQRPPRRPPAERAKDEAKEPAYALAGEDIRQ